MLAWRPGNLKGRKDYILGWHKGDRDRIDRKLWTVVRLEVLDRDGWRCTKCGRKGRLEVDHIQPMHWGGEKYDLANLATLCRGCHMDKTAEENRKDAEEAQPEEVKDWKAFIAERMADSV